MQCHRACSTTSFRPSSSCQTPCSISNISGARIPAHRHQRPLHASPRAGDNPFGDGPSTSSSSSSSSKAPAQPRAGGAATDAKEDRLEALEAAIRGRKVSTTPAKQIPIRNEEPKDEFANNNMAPWKEGQLFPEGWENMSAAQKATELYLGRRGFLFWLNKAAYASVFGLIGVWVLFRFVGPALGLYKLADSLGPGY